jgi:hypothetical protein
LTDDFKKEGKTMEDTLIIPMDRYEQLIQKEFVADQMCELLRAGAETDGMWVAGDTLRALAKAMGAIR